MSTFVESSPRPRAWVWPHVVALLVLAVAGWYGSTIYDRLPDRMPVHWSGSAPDSWSDRSFWSVFGVLFVGVAVVALDAFFGALLPRMSAHDGRSVRNTTATQITLGCVSLSVAVVIGVLAAAGWRASLGDGQMPGWATAFAILLPLLSLLAPVLYLKTHPAPPVGQSERSAEPGDVADPDDDRLWVAGGIYRNPADRRTFVPKRFGIGYTVNVATPGGIAFLVAMALIVVVSITMPLVLS